MDSRYVKALSNVTDGTRDALRPLGGVGGSGVHFRGCAALGCSASVWAIFG